MPVCLRSRVEKNKSASHTALFELEKGEIGNLAMIIPQHGTVPQKQTLSINALTHGYPKEQLQGCNAKVKEQQHKSMDAHVQVWKVNNKTTNLQYERESNQWVLRNNLQCVRLLPADSR